MRAHSRIVAVQGLTSLIAVVALILTVTQQSSRTDSLQSKLNNIQQSRADSSYDTCQLLQRIVNTSAALSKQPHAIAEAKKFLENVGLTDCYQHTIKVIGIPPDKR